MSDNTWRLIIDDLLYSMKKKPISRDDDLQSLVNNISQQSTGTGMDHNIICAATNRLLIAVGTMPLENRAMLLPQCGS